MKYRVTTLSLLLLAGCMTGPPRHTGGAMSGHFHFRPATTTTVGWIAALPGSTGLTIFDDDRHYYRAADTLNAHGWDVLLIDYRPAYYAAEDAPRLPNADKIAWVTRQAIAWLRANHPETADRPGALLGWSLGGEGVIRLVNDAEAVEDMGIIAAAAYYPSSRDEMVLSNTVPMLILTGEADDVITARYIRRMVEERSADSAPVELIVYEDTHHAFDVESLAEKKTVRALPFIGPKANLQYNGAAASQAQNALIEFLRKHFES